VGTAVWQRRWRELALVCLFFGALTVVLTFPLAFQISTAGRADNGDGQFSIWNVAWVARTLVVDPLHVFDANIFHPHRWTLAYSETNLGAGILAVPVYWATRNPYAAHNFVFLLSFVLSALGTYYLIRYLVDDRRAAVIGAICFAYCPYVFAHTPHIQLLMTAGMPFGLLAFHHLADVPTVRRGVVLGVTMAAQALFCGYYAIFVMLMIAWAVLLVAVTRGRWFERRYWIGVLVAAVVAAGMALLLFWPYLIVRGETGFTRSLDEARQWSADWRAYLASASQAHAWLLKAIGRWKEVLFPGFVALTFGIAGLAVGWNARGRMRETALLYGGLAGLSCWASFGPGTGLYDVLYSTVPAFQLLRAPSRFGIVVALGLSVLAGFAISRSLAVFDSRSDVHGRRVEKGTLAAILLASAAVVELTVPLSFPPVPATETAYRVLATLPRGPVIEMPVFSTRFAFARTQYMLSSTAHWMPLVNAYSDYIPQDFIDKSESLSGFPSREAFKILERDRVRYAVFHLDLYSPPARRDLVQRLTEFDRYLVARCLDDRVHLYEIIGFPP
jgi:hypothetical protein